MISVYKAFWWKFCQDTLAERLRRQIRNLLTFRRVGSSPARVEFFAFSAIVISYSTIAQYYFKLLSFGLVETSNLSQGAGIKQRRANPCVAERVDCIVGSS